MFKAAFLAASLGLAALVATPVVAGELHVYAGAGLKQPIDALAAEFEKTTGTKLAIEYGGSGQQLARYEETGVGDLFIPGSTFYLKKLEEKGLIASKTILVEHGPVLAVAKGKEDEIKSLADLAKPGVRVGLGDPKAMALGRTAEDILKASGLADKILPNVTVRAATVKQLALYVIDGNVDAAIVGASDAATNKDKFTAIAIPKDLYTAEVVPVAVLTTTTDKASAEAFAKLLASPEGMAVWKTFGFGPAGK